VKEIEQRRSIRAYLPTEVEEEKLLAILEAGRKAPSARNRQMWHFYVVSNPDLKTKIKALSRDQAMIEQAPICLVITATDDYVMGCKIPAYVVDPTIALSFMMLEATNQGLATCWIGAYDQDALKELLNLPAGETIIGMTPLGYAGQEPSARSYKSLEEIVTYLP